MKVYEITLGKEKWKMADERPIREIKKDLLDGCKIREIKEDDKENDEYEQMLEDRDIRQ